MAEKASLRRKMQPTLNGSLDRRYGSTDSLDSVDSWSSKAASVMSAADSSRLLMTSQHQPLILTPSRIHSNSVDRPHRLEREPIKHNDRERSKSVSVIGSPLRAKHNLIGSSPLKSKPKIASAATDASINGANNAKTNHVSHAASMPNVYRCNWLPGNHSHVGSAFLPTNDLSTSPEKQVPPEECKLSKHKLYGYC